jgi:hypothetical protein
MMGDNFLSGEPVILGLIYKYVKLVTDLSREAWYFDFSVCYIWWKTFNGGEVGAAVDGAAVDGE